MATKVKLIADGVITPDQITLTTASSGTNTTAPATTAFVQQEITALVDSSPAALNTLNELAAALGDDANFSTTVTNSIALKAPLASPAFTGAATFDTSIDVSGVITSKADGAVNDAQTGRLNFTNTNSNASSNPIRASILSGRQNSAWGGYLSLYTSTGTDAATEKVRIGETGRVGIGSTSPQANLVISNSGAGGFEFTPDTTVFSIANTNYIASYDRAASAYRDILLDVGGAESQSIRFKAGGNVGIGTSSPVAKLDVRMSDSNGDYGRGRDGNLNLENTNTSVTEGGWLSISGYMGNSASSGQYQMGYISGGKQTTAADGDYGGYLSLWTTSSGANGEANSGGYERMRIDSSGNVGIGETSPDGELHVKGTGGGNGDIYVERTSGAKIHLQAQSANGKIGTISNHNLGLNTNGTTRVTIDTNGRVGIGVQNCVSHLSIGNPSADGVIDYTKGITFVDTLTSPTNAWVHAAIVTTGSTGFNGNLIFATDGSGSQDNDTSGLSERMRITSAGEVVIGGTEIPSTVLDGTGAAGVLGIGNSSELYPAIALMSSQRNWLLYQNSLGNFQIYDSSSNDERFRLDTKGTMMTGASFAHNTYAHAAVFGRNSTPDGTVVIEDYDVSTGIGNTVLKLYFRDADPATHATFIDMQGGGNGRIGSVQQTDAGTGVVYNTSSDYRLKENVNYDWDATTLLKQLKPAKFNFISKPSNEVQGFLAHEVQDIVNGSVTGDRDHIEPIGTITDSNGDIVSEDVYEHFCKTDEGQTWTQTGSVPVYQQIDHSKLVPLLTKAIQEQQTIIESLTARLDEAGL